MLYRIALVGEIADKKGQLATAGPVISPSIKSEGAKQRDRKVMYQATGARQAANHGTLDSSS